MGYERAHAIIVSGSYNRPDGQHWADYAREKAVDIFNRDDEAGAAWDVVSPVMHSPINDVRTFLVAPDGGKEGWRTSDLGDERRAEFVAWLEAQNYDDLSSPLDWVEVQYGDDEKETVIVNDSDALVRAEPLDS
jgi:hypothetical protein